MLAHGVVKCAVRFVNTRTTTTTTMSRWTRNQCGAESCDTTGWVSAATVASGISQAYPAGRVRPGQLDAQARLVVSLPSLTTFVPLAQLTGSFRSLHSQAQPEIAGSSSPCSRV